MIFIPGNVPSLKNSKTMTTIERADNKRNILLPSKTVKKYLQSIGIKKYSDKGVVGYQTRLNMFAFSAGKYFDNLPCPAMIGFHFVRRDKRRFDFHNAVQILADLMVAHGFLVDDDITKFLPVPMQINGAWHTVNPDTPGVWIARGCHVSVHNGTIKGGPTND